MLLQPILWTLFGVLFSYVALYPPKVKVVKGLVYLLAPRDRSLDHEDDEDSPMSWHGIVIAAIGQYLYLAWCFVWFCIVPSPGTSASSVYFSILSRLMFAHAFDKIILRYFPETSTYVIRVATVLSVIVVAVHILNALRRNVILTKRRKLKQAAALRRQQSPQEDLPARSMTQRILFVQDRIEWTVEWFRIQLARWILPQAHLIAAMVVLSITTIVIGTLIAWTVFAFSDEVVYIYRNLANVVRMINAYLSHFAYYTLYVDKVYRAVSDWITSAVLADSASAKTRDLYDFISFVSHHQSELGAFAPITVASQSVAAATAAMALAASKCPTFFASMVSCSDRGLAIDTCSDHASFLPTTVDNRVTRSIAEFCKLNVVQEGRVRALGNATRAIVSAVNQDLESFVDNPYSLVDGFWELTDYYQDELKSGGTIHKGGDYLLTGMNYLKEILVQSGSISFAAIGSSVGIFTFLFDSVLQAIIYITFLFLLLQSNVGVYHYTAVLLHFVDPSTQLYRAIHRGLRAILISSLKMAIFHAGFVWLLFSYSEFPLVCIPTIIAFILGLVPVVSPVIVACLPLPIWAYANDQGAWAIMVISTCFVVWWSVGTSIYAEIPDSSVWMTTFSVGLGISLFGPRGVIVGPAIATIPFALYALGSAYISDEGNVATTTSIGGSVRLFNVMRIASTPRAQARYSPDSTSAVRRRRRARRTQSGNLPDLTRHNARPARPSESSGQANLDEMINEGQNGDKLFDFIMSTPRN